MKIHSKWISWYQRAGWNANFWMAVAKQAKKNGIKSNDRHGIMSICDSVYIKQFGSK